MNRLFIAVALGISALYPPSRAFAARSPAPATSAGQPALLSYALGYQAGLDLRQREPDIDLATVLRGVSDGYARRKPTYSTRDMRQVIRHLEQRMLANAREKYRQQAVANLEASRTFFAENQRKKGVITLASGVQYEVLGQSAGHGATPNVDSDVVLQFRARFLDGITFNTTADRGKPATLPVKYMVRGLRQTITRMHVGDHWRIFVPPDLAFGVGGNLPLIGPNEALVFDIDLLGVKPGGTANGLPEARRGKSARCECSATSDGHR